MQHPRVKDRSFSSDAPLWLVQADVRERQAAAPPPDVLVSPPLLLLTPRLHVALLVLLLHTLRQLGRVVSVPRP